MLRERNATGRRKVFDEAPTGFVPTKWRGYLDQARKSGDTTGNCACCSGCATAAQRGRVRMREKSTTARPMSRYFAGEGLSTYTHVTDQHTTYGTKVIVATKREAHYVLDEILVNATDLPITEHATDTPGSPWSTSGCSTRSVRSYPHRSGTWAASPSTGRAPAATPNPGSRTRDR